MDRLLFDHLHLHDFRIAAKPTVDKINGLASGEHDAFEGFVEQYALLPLDVAAVHGGLRTDELHLGKRLVCFNVS